MEILKIVIICTAAGILTAVIRKREPELAAQVALACGIIVLIYVTQYAAEAVGVIKETVQKLNIPGGTIKTVIKMIGIACICEVCCATLTDMKEHSLAIKVELAGRVSILLLTVPQLIAFVKLILGLTEKLA